jgi:hypothetical protein
MKHARDGLSRYNLVLPTDESNAVRNEANRQGITINGFLQWCIRTGIRLFREVSKPDTVFIIRSKNGDKELWF